MCVCVRACMCVCVRACVRVCVCVRRGQGALIGSSWMFSIVTSPLRVCVLTWIQYLSGPGALPPANNGGGGRTRHVGSGLII